MRYLIALSILGIFIQARSQALPDSTIKKINALFSGWDKTSSPGFAIGVIRNDSLIYSKGYGMANLEYGIPISPQTIFHMASVSKQFTAYSIVLLADKGKLQLEDDIHKYLPWFPDLKEKITIRHLLNHTSGIRDQWQLLAIGGTRLDDVITQEQIVKVLSKQQALNFKPGEQYMYSNSGFTMLAEIVKSVTGQTLRQFTDSAIFKPLGMNDTHFHDDYTEIVKNRAYSYDRDKESQFSNAILSYSNAGATSLFTNINDLSKWVINFYSPVAGTKATINQLVQNGKLNNGKEISYALGIAHDRYHGWTQYSHSGGDAGYRTWLTVFPDFKMGFLLFSNLGDADIYGRTYRLVDLFIRDSTTNKIANSDNKVDTTKAIVKDESRIKNLSGEFIGEDGARFSFKLRDHKLFWERNGNSDLLYPGIKDSFYVAKSPEVVFVFGMDKDKGTIVNEYWPDGKRLLFKYINKEPTSQQLKEYTGTYHSSELDCNYSIVLKDSSLLLTSTKYENSKLSFVGKNDLFTDYWWMHHLKVIRDKTSKIIGFEVNDGRVMRVRFDKMK